MIGVGQPLREREAGTRRRQGLEAQVLEVSGGTDVPWIGNDEAAVCVQRAECPAAGGGPPPAGGRAPERFVGAPLARPLSGPPPPVAAGDTGGPPVCQRPPTRTGLYSLTD